MRRTWRSGDLAIAAVVLSFLLTAVAVVAHGHGYMPAGDHALTELRVRDVGRHPVVTGLYSRNGWSHPGPMLFYLLAPLYRITGSSSLAVDVAAVAVNAVSVVGIAVVARRRGGVPMLCSALLGVALLVRTLGAGFVADPWNTYVTVLPFALLVFLTWAMACGDVWALPAGAATATLLAQTHVGFVLVAVPLLVGGAVVLVVGVVRDGRDGAARAPGLARAGVVSAVLLAILWAPVIADAVNGPPDNLARTVDWFRDEHSTHSVVQGVRVVFGQLGARPEWLVSRREPLAVSGEPAFLYSAPFPWMLALVAVAAFVLWRRRARDGLRLVAVFALTCAVAVVAVVRTVGLAFDYRLRWTWCIGMTAFVVIASTAWTAAADRREARRVLVPVAATALAVLCAVNAIVAVRAEPPRAADSAVMATIVPPVLAALAGERGVVVVDDGAYSYSSDYSRALLLQLERHGVSARMLAKDADVVGTHRVVGRGAIARRLVVAQDEEIAARDREPDLRRLARWTSVTPAQERAFRRAAAALDRGVARGRLDPVARALRLKEIGLGTHDDAVAWSVAVYVVEPAT